MKHILKKKKKNYVVRKNGEVTKTLKLMLAHGIFYGPDVRPMTAMTICYLLSQRDIGFKRICMMKAIQDGKIAIV